MRGDRAALPGLSGGLFCMDSEEGDCPKREPPITLPPSATGRPSPRARPSFPLVFPMSRLAG